MAREREAAAMQQRQDKQEAEWLRERLKVEDETAAEIRTLKQAADSVAQKLAQLSSNSQALMEGEAKAIETGEGEVKRVELLPSDTFGGHTQEEFHFRLAESQFLRMVGSGGGYHVTKVRQAQTVDGLCDRFGSRELINVR